MDWLSPSLSVYVDSFLLYPRYLRIYQVHELKSNAQSKDMTHEYQSTASVGQRLGLSSLCKSAYRSSFLHSLFLRLFLDFILALVYRVRKKKKKVFFEIKSFLTLFSA